MNVKEFFVGVLKLMFPRKKKYKYGPGVIGHYNCKPYHNFKYALIYACETPILESEEIEIYSRVYRDTTFVNVLVNKEINENFTFDIKNYKFENIKKMLEGKEYKDPKTQEMIPFKETKNNIVLVLFQHRNEETIKQCKLFCESTKTNFEQACVYNPVDVHMDFYKPVPKFYKLFDIYCEDLYFDLAFIDDAKED